MFKTHKGFTLIELLIVITIIGILSVAFIPQLTGGQARARDTRRQADLQQIATALALYADDHGGVYPGTAACISEISDNLTPYLTTVPNDPLAGNAWADGECAAIGKGYDYIPMDVDSVSGMAGGFLLIANLENVNGTGEGMYQADGFDGSDDSLTAQETLAANTACADAACTDTGVIYVYAR